MSGPFNRKNGRKRVKGNGKMRDRFMIFYCGAGKCCTKFITIKYYFKILGIINQGKIKLIGMKLIPSGFFLIDLIDLEF